MHRKERGRRALLAAASLLALTGTALAGEGRAADIEGVVVTGRLEETLPAELARYGHRLEVVTAEEIEAGGFVDAGQALSALVPGLHLAPQSGAFSYNTASLQGSRPGEILYLIDGVRISNRLYNTTPPLDTVPAHMIDRIEVLDGAQGLFFGTQAVAGVINITIRPFTTDTTGRMALGGDSNGAYAASGFVSGSGGGGRFVAYASHDQSRGFRPFPQNEFQPSGTDRHRGYRLSSAGLKYAYDFGDDVRISASYQHTEGWVDFARPNLTSRAVNKRDEEIATAKLDWRVNEALQLFVKGYWHDWDSHYDEVDNVPGGGTAHVSDDEFWGFWDYGVNAVAQVSVRPGVEAYLGYDLQNYWGRDDVLLIADRTERTQAVFAQLRLTPEVLPNTHLAAGVRHNRPDQGEDATVWSLSGQYDLSDLLFVRGAAGTAFRLPDAEQLFAQDPVNNGEVGNPNLKPERSRNLNLSAGANGAGWTAELIGFWRDTRDLIDLAGETPDPDVATFINTPGKVTAKGFEAVATAQPNPSVSLKASWTHARTHVAGSGLQLAGVPKDIAQGVLDVHPVGWRVGGAAIASYVGDVVDNVPSGFGRQPRGNYAVVDLDAWVTFGPGDHHKLSARLENALGEAYTSAVRRSFRDADGSAYLLHYRGVPRTVHVTYAYSF
ncbi:MAG: TonB-dependent receptor for transport vitamin [Caulobacteraceae bacterium]|nr:TonB-dependent receptor for transport vitamin [Caulobacteraceae bacterium]